MDYKREKRRQERTHRNGGLVAAVMATEAAANAVELAKGKKMGHSKTSALRLRAAERRVQIWGMRVAGQSITEIGKAIGCSRQRVWKVLKEQFDALSSKAEEQKEQVRITQNERYEKLLAGIWSKAIAGDLEAITSVLAIMRRQASLYGLETVRSEATKQPTFSVTYQQIIDARNTIENWRNERFPSLAQPVAEPA